MSTFIPKRQKSAKSNSEPSSNGSSPPASVNLTSGSNINQVANNNNNINATNNNINNAPKFGTLVPNRVFVGGISSTTTETELCQLFSKYGNVKATKIIADRAGVSKGYGFVTFETDEEAKRLQLDADIFLKDRRLNIAPAIIKQPFPARGYEATTSPPPATNVYFHNGMPYTFHNGMAFFPQAQSQTAPLPPAPEAPVYQGTGYGPSQGPTQTFTQPMMYPCANPPPMFISPQYPQYQHVPISNQAATHIMYSSGVNPTANNGTDSSTSVPISAHPSPSFYITPGELRTEVFYNMPPATAHGCFGQVMVTSHDPSLHFCDVQTEPNNSTISAEVTAQHQRGAFQQSFVAANSGMQHMHAQSHAHAHTHAGYAPPGYQQPPLLQQPPQPPPPPRRFVNNNRRANANNNSQGNMRKGKCGELMDSGAAGDAPVQSLMTPPSSPGVGKGVQSSTSNVVSNEIAAQDMLCASVQNLSVN